MWGFLKVSHAFYRRSICHPHRSLNPRRNLILHWPVRTEYIMNTSNASNCIERRRFSFCEKTMRPVSEMKRESCCDSEDMRGFPSWHFHVLCVKKLFFSAASSQEGSFRSREQRNIIAAIVKLFYSLNRRLLVIDRTLWLMTLIGCISASLDSVNTLMGVWRIANLPGRWLFFMIYKRSAVLWSVLSFA